jgi:hypothetical protein
MTWFWNVKLIMELISQLISDSLLFASEIAHRIGDKRAGDEVMITSLNRHCMINGAEYWLIVACDVQSIYDVNSILWIRWYTVQNLKISLT